MPRSRVRGARGQRQRAGRKSRGVLEPIGEHTRLAQVHDDHRMVHAHPMDSLAFTACCSNERPPPHVLNARRPDQESHDAR